jgi:hypothetical protein
MMMKLSVASVSRHHNRNPVGVTRFCLSSFPVSCSIASRRISACCLASVSKQWIFTSLEAMTKNSWLSMSTPGSGISNLMESFGCGGTSDLEMSIKRR